MDLNEVVCTCTGVTNGMIKEAVASGADTLEKVQDATQAGTVCGVCLDKVNELIATFLSEKQ